MRKGYEGLWLVSNERAVQNEVNIQWDFPFPTGDVAYPLKIFKKAIALILNAWNITHGSREDKVYRESAPAFETTGKRRE